MRATTSSSNLLRRQLCPGSARLETGIPEQDSIYSAEGTMLHALYMTGDRPESLTEDQCLSLDIADRETEDFFALFAKQNGLPDDAPFEDFHERELNFTGKYGVKFPGHSDVIRFWISEEYRLAALADAKFGYCDVDEAADNLQLASYAVMLQQDEPTSPFTSIGVCIVQPRNFGPKSSSAIYDAASLDIAAVQIEEIVLLTMEPDAPLNPSEDACRYCKAKLTCPALTGRALELVESDKLTTKTAPDYLLAISDDRLGYIMDAIKLAKMLEPHAKAEATTRIQNGQLTEWELKPGNILKHVTDTLGAYSLLLEQAPGLTELQYMAACKLSMTSLKKPIAELLGIPQTKAEKLIKSILAPVIEEKQNAPSVVRKEAN